MTSFSTNQTSHPTDPIQPDAILKATESSGSETGPLPLFPGVIWGTTEARFYPAPFDAVSSYLVSMEESIGSQEEAASRVPPGVPADARLSAALTIVVEEGRFLVANIVGRGWCIPGGRLEPGETPEQAARREAWEEAGAILGPLTLLGGFLLTDIARNTCQWVPTYLAEPERYEAPPQGFESQGVTRMTQEELPTSYYTWDILLEAVFAHALTLWKAQKAGTTDPG